VLAPLGMRASSFVWSEALGAKLAMGHDETGAPFEVYGTIGREAAKVAARWKKPLEEWRYEDAIEAVPIIRPGWPRLPVFMMPNAAASFLTTADDYARFLQRVVARDGEPGLELSPRMRQEMAKRQRRLNSALGWGLGWGLQQDEGGSFLWHWGANMSFRNFAIADPAGGRAVVALTNGLNGPKVYERIVATVTGYDHPAFLWPYL
jgi:CubicO group peptidase (beta-lactamase class C family)